MPSLAALTIADGATTPVNHTFSPVTSTGREAQWADRSSATPNGYRVIRDTVREPASAGAAHRRLIGFNFPVEALVDGVTKVVRNSSAQVTLNFSAESTEQERKDALAYVTNFLGNTSVKAAIPALEPFY